MTEPDRPELRISDADRERAVQRLHDALAEGRLTIDEFDERVAQVWQARTGSQLQPHLADLPAVPGGAGSEPAPERSELRTTMSNLKREGRWKVPRQLVVHSKAGSVKLDLTDAVISHPVIELTLEVFMGSVTLVLPRGASVDVDGVESGMVASNIKIRQVPRSPERGDGPHVVVTAGKVWTSSLVVRHQRRFLWWRW